MKFEHLRKAVKGVVNDLGLEDPVKVLERVKQDHELTTSEQDDVMTLARRMVESNEMRRSLRERSTPMYIVEDFVDQNPIWYDDRRMWWVWDREGRHWRMADEVDITNMIYDENEDTEIINSSERQKYLNAFKMVCRRTRPAEVPRTWLQFADCYVDIDDLDSPREPDSSYFFANRIPHDYGTAPAVRAEQLASLDEGASLLGYPPREREPECPTIDRLFREWVGEEKKGLLYEICAYCMLPDYPIHRIFCLVGSGGNGKGSFMRLLKRLVGTENVASTTLDRLADSRFEAAKLYKKLVAFVGETDFSTLNSTAMLKSLVGQDLISGEFKNKDPFDFYNYAKVVIATNSLPATGDKTVGFYRRWVIIDFKEFYDVERDVLEDVPEEEYSALARKCARMLPDLLRRGRFADEGDHRQKAEDYEERSNPIKRFVEEKLERGGPDDKIPFFQFKEAFLAFLSEHKFRRMNDSEIKGQLKDNNIEYGPTNYKAYNNSEWKRWVCVFGYRWKNYGSFGRFGSDSALSPLHGDLSVTSLPNLPNLPRDEEPNPTKCDWCNNSAVINVPDKYAKSGYAHLCDVHYRKMMKGGEA